jgi:acyl carrier protein
MSDTRARLERCFQAVFPTLTTGEIQSATPDTTEAWDSLASLTLIQVIEDEFGLRIDPFEFAEIASFDRLQSHIRDSTGM